MPRIRAENIAAHKKLTRRQILEAASELFLEHGYAATSLGDIAAVVGIGRTTLYEYFRDKEEILVELVEASIPTLVEEMIASLPQGLGYAERLGELLVRNLEFISDESNLGTLIMRELPMLSAEAQERVRNAHRLVEEEIASVCAGAVSSGEFRSVDPYWAGRLVSAMMMGTARALLREADPKQRIHQAADVLIELLLNGLVARD